MEVLPRDILFALKAINLTSDLRNNDRAVAAAVLDHFNRKTGQCDPGLDRIAGLLGISSRTVMRSMDRIVAARLFHRARHGGHLNRNSYEPNWPRFREIEAAWSARMKATRGIDDATEMSPATRQPRHLDGDNPVTQTCTSNLSKETSKGLPKEVKGKGYDSNTPAPTSPPIQQGPAHVAAERRWSTALHEAFASMPLTYGEIIQAITPEIETAATDAELRRRGAGFDYIVTRLKLADRRTPLPRTANRSPQQ